LQKLEIDYEDQSIIRKLEENKRYAKNLKPFVSVVLGGIVKPSLPLTLTNIVYSYLQKDEKILNQERRERAHKVKKEKEKEALEKNENKNLNNPSTTSIYGNKESSLDDDLNKNEEVKEEHQEEKKKIYNPQTPKEKVGYENYVYAINILGKLVHVTRDNKDTDFEYEDKVLECIKYKGEKDLDDLLQDIKSLLRKLDKNPDSTDIAYNKASMTAMKIVNNRQTELEKEKSLNSSEIKSKEVIQKLQKDESVRKTRAARFKKPDMNKDKPSTSSLNPDSPGNLQTEQGTDKDKKGGSGKV